jgi:hypothetical protein
MTRLETRTAEPQSSIWRDIPEDRFRQHLVDLEKRTNAVPLDPQIFPLKNDKTSAYDYALPLKVEHQISADFAFLAAIEEGAQSVAAACLEQHRDPVRLTVRFASLDLALGNEMKRTLQEIADDLVSECNSSESRDGNSQEGLTEKIFEKIVCLHFRRLLARLRSNKWEKPKYLSRQHKKPLWQDFTNIIHRVQFLFTKRESTRRRLVETKLHALANTYEGFEASEAGTAGELSALQTLIKKSYEFCLAEDIAEFARRLEGSVSTTPTAKVGSAIKCLRQIEKIASYWRIAISLVATSRKYPELFRNKLQLAFLAPYKGIPTKIGYESWATTCHVHAEVQLAVYYDLRWQNARDVPETDSRKPDFCRPRVIGTSKQLCYLCYLFLRSHGSFIPADTHGRLYDQWTIPDLIEYDDELRANYRRIVYEIDKEVIRERDTLIATMPPGTESSLVRWRAEPMTSRQNLLGDSYKLSMETNEEEKSRKSRTGQPSNKIDQITQELEDRLGLH